MSSTIKRNQIFSYLAGLFSRAALTTWPAAALLLIAMLVSLGSVRSPPRDSPPFAATEGSKSCDLGRITAGGAREAELRLVNASSSVIEIARVRTSCPCIQVTLLEHRIGPRQTAVARVRLDLAQEPEFVGGLCPEIEFLDAAGRSLFVRTVNATVVRPGIEP